jgi:hypothetical protein
VKGEEVGRGVHVLGALDTLDAELTEAVRRDERVVCDDAHPKPCRPAGDLLPDAAEAEHAESLVGQLDAAVGLALPSPLLERRVGLRNVTGQGDEQADRVLRGRDDGRFRCVRDDDAASRGGVDVDVVDPDPRAADHLQSVGALDYVGGQLCRGSDHDRVVARDRVAQVAVAVDVHLEASLT